MKIAQNGQSPWLVGDVAGQPKPMCYTDGISCSKQANNCSRIHFRFRRDHQSILVKSLTWWCSCIEIVRKITFGTCLGAKNLPGGWTQVLNVCWIKRFDCHPPESDENCAPESISDTKCWLNWNGDSDIPTTAKKTARQTMYSIQSPTMAARFWKSECTELWVPDQMFLDWYGQHGDPWTRLPEG